MLFFLLTERRYAANILFIYSILLTITYYKYSFVTGVMWIDTYNVNLLKDVMPVSFRSELFTSYILTIFKH